MTGRQLDPEDELALGLHSYTIRNTVQVVILAYTLIHGCDPNKYQAGEIVEILPPDPNPSPEWRMEVNKLRMEILQKKTGWRPHG